VHAEERRLQYGTGNEYGVCVTLVECVNVRAAEPAACVGDNGI
jgi:hypothetical protein